MKVLDFEKRPYTAVVSSPSCFLSSSGLWHSVLFHDSGKRTLLTVGTRTCHLRNPPPLHYSRTCHHCSRCICQNHCSCAAGISVSCHGRPLNPVHAGESKRDMSHNKAFMKCKRQHAKRWQTHLRGLAIRSLALAVFGSFWSVVVRVITVRAGAAGGGVVLRRGSKGKHNIKVNY